MDQGATFEDGSMYYMTDVLDDDSATIEAFYERASVWIQAKGLKVGEGTLTIYRNKSDLPVNLEMWAPIVSGPTGLCEDISDTM